LKKLGEGALLSDIDKYGKAGVTALRKATPIDEGDTRAGWGYRVTKDSLVWYNTHVNQGQNIAILIQYGHGTGTGGYIQGRDYINPAIRPIFDKIASDIRKKVKSG
jgi:hypothetical protein